MPISRSLPNISYITAFGRFLATGQYSGERILRLPAYWSQPQHRAMIRTLEKRRVLAPDEDFKAGVWRVVQAAIAPTAEEAICLVDPFAYISHLSAMQRYGVTDRSPEALHVTTPARTLWTHMRDVQMAEDYEDEPAQSLLPQLSRIGIREQVRRRRVIIHESKHPAEPAPIAGSVSRIATIGRVFVDMLDQPLLCGGVFAMCSTVMTGTPHNGLMRSSLRSIRRTARS
ncbi:hypothetical protein ACFSTD_05760 [Novosphingobium colocasiae]